MNFVYFSKRRDAKLSEVLPLINESYDSIIGTHDSLTLYHYMFTNLFWQHLLQEFNHYQ